MSPRDRSPDDTINWPLYPKSTEAYWPRRRVEPDDCVTRSEDVAASNEDAQAFLAYNARVKAATDALLIRLARWAVVLVGGSTVGLYAINVVWGGA
jgi:hypothetical protein